ncbi:glycoside hydrolase family 108 protein [Cronobacter turicensis]|uniref:glycoside hydrolase family 108 protein n=1 Tax=Cronobacter turicensis TaxID=413502 RepID=UPI000CFAD13E|nr:putative peptidoglycan-binding domain-containing protein [Cronobacter turicensis]EKM0364191.1 glycoside hydrolase family 108 protein [Cronobacter turicensis]EKM0372523.1 glycoside hydrolase family 108 protein [Cronobacter turicensis]EKM0533528.1 glycoside hydrolase family 108 protein [Cronobacter turicensis]ELQ6108939.1 glycoside hydrolase family 108 protein [Cronobacter turicensis]ELY3598533.1 glycoside hydrolase family 108 protein [Cronobacter turicensis]
MNPVIDGILNIEGSYVNHPADRGGPTKWGITEKTARAHGYKGDMRDMSREEAYGILEKDYWISPGFDRIAQYSLPIAFELCEAGTNIGPAVPVRWLQRWLNVFNRQQSSYQDLIVDGVIGKDTLNALKAYLERRGKEGEGVLVKALNCTQGDYYLDITEKREANEAFIYGWLRERVALS